MPAYPRCPKCAGRLYLDRDGDGLTAAELACLACGWRRTVTLAEVGVSEPTGRFSPQITARRRRG